MALAVGGHPAVATRRMTDSKVAEQLAGAGRSFLTPDMMSSSMRSRMHLSLNTTLPPALSSSLRLQRFGGSWRTCRSQGSAGRVTADNLTGSRYTTTNSTARPNSFGRRGPLGSHSRPKQMQMSCIATQDESLAQSDSLGSSRLGASLSLPVSSPHRLGRSGYFQTPENNQAALVSLGPDQAGLPSRGMSTFGSDLLATLLPGMRVVSINGSTVSTPEDITRLYQANVCVLEVQDDESAALLPLHRAGLSGCGQLSPTVPVANASSDRRAVHVPEWAENYRMAYPIEGLSDIAEDVLEQLNWDDPSLCLALMGGMVYFDSSGDVCGACALTSGETVHFDGPFPWRQEYTEELRLDGRIAPVALPYIREAGITEFAYLVPNETLGGTLGNKTWRMARHGGYVYFVDPSLPKRDSGSQFTTSQAASSMQSPRRVHRSGSSAFQSDHADGDIFFVALAQDTGGHADSWEQIRVCPHCRSQQREDLAVLEVPGAMRCDNCGQLSALQEKEESAEGQDLMKALGTLLGYFAVLGAYIVLGASVMQAVELPHERKALRDAQQRYDQSMAAAARDLAELVNSSAAASSGDLGVAKVERRLAELVDALFAGDVTLPVPCTPTTQLQWERFTSATFWVYCMVITVPEVFPVTNAGRVFFVFYVVGGLVCVLNVIFDLAHVFPSVVRTVFRLCREKHRHSHETNAAAQQQRQADLFEQADYDGTGTLTLTEFREFLELYEGAPIHGEDAAFSEDTVQLLMSRVDDGSGELSREDVRKATMLWERMKAEKAQMPGSYMVAGSVFGNLAWIVVCALLLNATEGFQVIDALWLCYLTLTTMGFSIFIPQTLAGQLVAMLYFLVGLGSLAWLFEAIGRGVQARIMRIVRALAPACPCGQRDGEAVWLPIPPPVRFYTPSDPFGELSPEYPVHLEVDGKVFPSVLHFLSYMRFRGTRHEKKLNAPELTTLEMLYHLLESHSTVSRHDWASVRDDLMLTALCHLITQNQELRALLLSTGDRPLIYDTRDAPADFVDAFELAHWGTRGESGENRLGELLQTLRLDLRRGIKTDLRPGVCSSQPISFYGYSNAQYAMFNPSFPCPFTDRNDQTWPTVEHFYQAHKFESLEYRQRIQEARTLLQVSQLAAATDVPGGLVPDWEEGERVRVMNEALILKFAQNPRARQLLHQTGSRELVFCDPSDSFLGNSAVNGVPGTNMLGRLLMMLRENLRTGLTPKELLIKNDQTVYGSDGLAVERYGSGSPLSPPSFASWFAKPRKGAKQKRQRRNSNGSEAPSASESSPATSPSVRTLPPRDCTIPSAAGLCDGPGTTPNDIVAAVRRDSSGSQRASTSQSGLRTSPAVSIKWSPDIFQPHQGIGRGDSAGQLSSGQVSERCPLTPDVGPLELPPRLRSVPPPRDAPIVADDGHATCHTDRSSFATDTVPTG
eukprot:TRINITY_DN92_c1_g1_i2.p1 TRINITY_DN92_c1_g1~~TRINITY_DN92_c1_g1_i2.p1  ORF type:complete len:1645 (+),score=315.25 TRINITY_DN92_c1_g1_i2:654-4937(+)